MILDVEFETEKDRLRFEDYLKRKNFNRRKLTNYHERGEFQMHFAIYYAGYMGYYDPIIILKDCLKKKIKITYFAWLPISDRDSYWNKERGRMSEYWNKQTIKKCYECIYGEEPLCNFKDCLVNKKWDAK